MSLPRPAPGTLKWWVIGVVGCLLMGVLAAWWGLSATVGKATWTTTAYTIDDDSHVTVTWQVGKPTDKATTCTVQALAQDFSTVGQVDVEVPRGGPEQRDLTTTVRTTQRAVNGRVKVCTVPR